MEEAKNIRTLIVTATKLDMDEIGSSMEQILHREMIGTLLYLTASRPGIVFSVELCARLKENLKEFHLKSVKRILRYLKETTDIVL